MTPCPIAVRPEAPLHLALGLLIRRELGALPVVDQANRIVGLLSERDLLRIFSEPEAMTVSAVMDRAPVTVTVDESIVEVVDRLMANDLRRVLVREGRTLVGVISRADLMPAILEVLRERACRLLDRSPSRGPEAIV